MSGPSSPGGIFHRWAEPQELAAVARLSAQIFDPDTALAESWIARLVDDIATGAHPLARPDDYAIAIDEDGGGVVGAAVLFTQPWRIGSTTFNAGRPEVVVTASTHRGRGVMRGLLELLEARSAEHGDVAQCITGVPGVYRRLGYEYTHPLGDGRSVRVPGRRSPGAPVTFAAAGGDDADQVVALLGAARPRTGITTPQCAAYVRFAALEQNPASRRGVRTLVARAPDGRLAAVFQLARGAEPHLRVLAAAIADDADPREALLALLEEESVGPGDVTLALGEAHELYEVVDALGWQSRREVPDRWYFRIPAVAPFLAVLRRELDAQLAASVFRRHTGELTLDLRPSRVTLRIEDGVIASIDEGPGSGPRLTVSPESLPALLTGAVALRDLVDATPETRGSPLAVALGSTLFARRDARTLPLD